VSVATIVRRPSILLTWSLPSHLWLKGSNGDMLSGSVNGGSAEPREEQSAVIPNSVPVRDQKPSSRSYDSEANYVLQALRVQT